MADQIRIEVNGISREVPSGLTISTLLKYLQLPEDRVAVELNQVIVRKAEWDSAPVESGARIEVVHFVGGGQGAGWGPGPRSGN